MGCGGSKAAEGGQQPQPAAKKSEGTPKKETPQQSSGEQSNNVPQDAGQSPAEATQESEVKEESSTEKQGEFSEFEQTTLRHHNECRSKHGVADMTLSKELCTSAQAWADQLAAKQEFEHSKGIKMADGQSVGENLYMSMSSAPEVSGDGATQSWYDEIKDYDYNNPCFSMKTGHFTQVVWQGSTMVGVGSATYKKDDWYTIVVVAHYGPPGNYMDQFAENVPKLL